MRFKITTRSKRKSIQGRFWDKVDKVGPTSCWVWTGAKSGGGYGSFTFEGRLQSAHRVAWQLLIGPIPDGIELCHDCPSGDNPLCVNPAHMFLGTHRDNITDCIKKGRRSAYRPPSNDDRRRKLSEIDIPIIRELRSQGVSCSELARRYGTSPDTIANVCSRKTWASVP